MASDKPKSILIGQVKEIPDTVWEKICEAKRQIMQKNKKRGAVSHEEAIYKLIQNNCA